MSFRIFVCLFVFCFVFLFFCGPECIRVGDLVRMRRHVCQWRFQTESVNEFKRCDWMTREQ